jgi:hypothetical protein
VYDEQRPLSNGVCAAAEEEMPLMERSGQPDRGLETIFDFVF